MAEVHNPVERTLSQPPSGAETTTATDALPLPETQVVTVLNSDVDFATLLLSSSRQGERIEQTLIKITIPPPPPSEFIATFNDARKRQLEQPGGDSAVAEPQCIPLLKRLSLLKSTATHQNAEYSNFSCVLPDEPQRYAIEIISPASEKQIERSQPSPLVMFRETGAMYAAVTEPYITSQATDRALSWVYNCTSLAKERERVLLDTTEHGGFILNVDTKWKTHAPCLTTPQAQWGSPAHSNLNDLYCLAIVKPRGLRTIRDLRREHVPLLQSILSAGGARLQAVYGVAASGLRVFLHYLPQFFHLHVHFTRLGNEVGCQVERGHLLEDVIDNLRLDSDYYCTRALSFKLNERDDLCQRLLAWQHTVAVDGP